MGYISTAVQHPAHVVIFRRRFSSNHNILLTPFIRHNRCRIKITNCLWDISEYLGSATINTLEASSIFVNSV